MFTMTMDGLFTGVSVLLPTVVTTILTVYFNTVNTVKSPETVTRSFYRIVKAKAKDWPGLETTASHGWRDWLGRSLISPQPFFRPLLKNILEYISATTRSIGIISV